MEVNYSLYGLVTDLSGKPNYGLYSFGNMKEIVSSGFCGWGIPLRRNVLVSIL